MLSRNVPKRQAENNRYVHFLNNWTKEVKQFFLRLKGTKEYKYFRCPSCKNRLRLRRGCGEKHITCPVCKHQFTMVSKTAFQLIIIFYLLIMIFIL